jgi:hypothetical protein
LGEPGVVSRELVEKIWSDVAAEDAIGTESLRDPLPVFERLVHDEERRYLNARCEFDTTPAEVAATGKLATLKRRLKNRAGHFVVAVLERYFAEEHEFIAHLVRLQNKLTVHEDRLANEVLALHRALRVESKRLRDRSTLQHHALEERIEALERQLAARDRHDA